MARKWQYQIIDIRKFNKSPAGPGYESCGGIDNDRLNSLGEIGWELVCIHSDGMTGVFKRLVEKR